MAKKKKESRFAGKAASSMKSQNSHSGFGYLKNDGLKMYAPVPGAVEFFDIIPYIVTTSKHPDKFAEKGEQWFKRPFKTHKNVGVDDVTVVCLTSFGKRCPICEYRAKRAKEGADKDELAELNTSSRTLWALRPVADPGKKKGKPVDQDIHVMEISDFCFQKPLTAELEENEDFETFADLESGFTLKVRWNEESFNGNKFAKAGRIDFLKRAEELSEDLLEEVPSLDKLLIELSFEEMQAKFFETDSVETDDDDDEEEEEQPRKKFESSSKKKPAKVEEEDDDEEDEPAPKRKAKPAPVEIAAVKDRKMVRKPEYEPEEDDDEDEEEETGLADQIEDAEDVEDLMEIAKENKEFKSHLKVLKTITKAKLLKNEMLAILNPSDDEDDDEEEEAPAPKRKAQPEPQKKSKVNSKQDECPHDHEFGVDTEEYDECDDCKLWEHCIEAKEAKAKKKK